MSTAPYVAWARFLDRIHEWLVEARLARRLRVEVLVESTEDGAA